MLRREAFAKAASDLDELSESGLTLDRILFNHDIDPEGVTYVAKQRALRAALVLVDGWTPGQIEEAARTRRRLNLSPDALEAMSHLAALWLEGVLVGRRVQRPPMRRRI